MCVDNMCATAIRGQLLKDHFPPPCLKVVLYYLEQWFST